MLHYVSQNSTVSLSLLFSKKAENALAFLHILLTSRKKKIIISLTLSVLRAPLFL